MNVEAVRRDFPILQQRVHGDRPLVYLDSAATSQKPVAVIEAIETYYRTYNANVHRAIHTLGEKATEAYEGARARVARFIGAPSPQHIVFTRGATEALNVVAHGWARRHLRSGDTIVCTPMEHHSNLVPWQMVAQATGATLRFIELTEDGRLDEGSWRRLIEERPRLVAVSHCSNVLGTINPVEDIVRYAHEHGARVVVDGAQSAPHLPVDMQAMDADFFAFSAHKMCGPTGVGVLYGKMDALEEMEPLFGGGDMIRSVRLEGSDWNDIPYRFEAGTPNIAGVIGLGAAVDYLEALGMEAVAAHEAEIAAYALERLAELPSVQVYGPRDHRAGLVTFNVEGVHPHDLSTFLDREGIAIRAGHHCCQPLMNWLGVPATARASFYVYTDRNDVDRLVEGLSKAKEFFRDVS